MIFLCFYPAIIKKISEFFSKLSILINNPRKSDILNRYRFSKVFKTHARESEAPSEEKITKLIKKRRHFDICLALCSTI